jgi:hypothetical protein
MCTPSSVSTVGSAFGRQLISQKMFGACASVAAPAKNIYLVNKI